MNGKHEAYGKTVVELFRIYRDNRMQRYQVVVLDDAKNACVMEFQGIKRLRDTFIPIYRKISPVCPEGEAIAKCTLLLEGNASPEELF